MSTLFTVPGANLCWLDRKNTCDTKIPVYKKRPFKVRQTPLIGCEDAHVWSDAAIQRLKDYRDKMIANAITKTLPVEGSDCIVNKIGNRLNNMCGTIRKVYPTGQVDVFILDLNREMRFSVDELEF